MSDVHLARRATPIPPPPPPPPMLFDTGALLNLAVDTGLWELARDRFAARAQVPLAVVNELRHLLDSPQPGVPRLARFALSDLDWLGAPLPLDDDRREDAVTLQGVIAAGRPLQHPLQHFGEATLIVLGEPLGADALIDDYDARVAAARRHLHPLSIQRVLHLWIQAKVVTPTQAKAYADAIRDAGRGADFETQELIDGGRSLGRAGQP